MNEQVKVKIDWKSIFEKILNIKVSNETLIKVTNFNKLIKNIRWLTLCDDAIFLNHFYVSVFFKYRSILEFYSIVDTYYVKRNFQRHEQCLQLIDYSFPQAMLILVNRLISNETRSFVQSTYNQVVKMIENLIGESQTLTQSEKEEYSNELSNIVKTKYFRFMIPDVELQDFSRNVYESFNENDTLTRILLDGKILRDEKLRVKTSSNMYTLGKKRQIFKFQSLIFFNHSQFAQIYRHWS